MASAPDRPSGARPAGTVPSQQGSQGPVRPVRPPRVPLGELDEWLAVRTPVRLTAPAGPQVVVSGVTLTTARVRPGDLYAALPGSRAHGADFVPEAVTKGAVAVLTDPDGLSRLGQPPVPTLVVDRPRWLLGSLSARVYGDPAAAMRTVGVTGTHGKTTVTRLAEAALQHVGRTAAVVGTVGTRIDAEDVPTALTTPEAPDLHGLFAVMRERGVEVCALEVSSHALVLGRVDGVLFDLAVFTNLGRDHLDFHAGMEDYFAAKASLFTPERARAALVCVDDAWGRRLAETASVPVRTYALHDREADWWAEDVATGPGGSRFTARGPDGVRVATQVNLPGDFNVANALAAVASAAEVGFDAAEVGAGLAAVAGVPGRLERVDAGQEFLIVVDYAHKPDAVAAALRTLRPLTAGRLIVVLGAGGDRDAGKRPLMGAVAARLADVLVVTDDNPRREDPAAIRAAVLAGARTEPGASAEVLEIGDRRRAIRVAMERAVPGDVVLVAGKGHETGQEAHGVTTPFDDRVVAAEMVAELLQGSAR